MTAPISYALSQKMGPRWLTAWGMMTARQGFSSHFRKLRKLVESRLPEAEKKKKVKEVINDIKKALSELEEMEESESNLLISIVRMQSAALEEAQSLAEQIEEIRDHEGFPAGIAEQELNVLDDAVEKMVDLDDKFQAHLGELSKGANALSSQIRSHRKKRTA